MDDGKRSFHEFVIAVETDYPLPSCELPARIPCGQHPLVLWMFYQTEPGIVDVGLQDGHGSIRRAIIDSDDLIIRAILQKNTVDATADKLLPIIYRYDD
jgi:hypothetical protein